MINNNSPCLLCSDRYPGCHSWCTNYITWRAKRADELARQYKQRNVDYDLNDFSAVSAMRRHRRKHGKDSGRL